MHETSSRLRYLCLAEAGQSTHTQRKYDLDSVHFNIFFSHVKYYDQKYYDQLNKRSSLFVFVYFTVLWFIYIALFTGWKPQSASQ